MHPNRALRCKNKEETLICKNTRICLSKEMLRSLCLIAFCLACFFYLSIKTKLQLIEADWILMQKYRPESKQISCPSSFSDRKNNSNRKSLRIVNFNTDWLFLYGPRCPSNACTWKSKAEALLHVKHVAHLLDTLDADIVHLGEIEGCAVLRVLLEMLPNGHEYTPFLIAGQDSTTRQNVALLSRFPVLQFERSEQRVKYPLPDSQCTVPKRGSVGLSKHYLAKIRLQEREIVLLGVHLIAHPNDHRKCTRREAQAQAIHEIIKKEISNDQEFIILGDFNDHDDEATCQSPDGQRSQSKTVGRLRNLLRIENLACRLPSEQRYSAWHDTNKDCIDSGPEEHSLLDHVLISPGLQNKVRSVKVYHGYKAGCKRNLSDHWPVIVELEL